MSGMSFFRSKLGLLFCAAALSLTACSGGEGDPADDTTGEGSNLVNAPSKVWGMARGIIRFAAPNVRVPCSSAKSVYEGVEIRIEKRDGGSVVKGVIDKKGIYSIKTDYSGEAKVTVTYDGKEISKDTILMKNDITELNLIIYTPEGSTELRLQECG